MSTDRYLDEFPGEEQGDPVMGTTPGQAGSSSGAEAKENRLLLFWESLSRAGLGEMASRLGTNLLLVALVLGVIFAMRAFYLNSKNSSEPARKQGVAVAAQPSPTPTEILPALPPLTDTLDYEGITRLAMLHTIIPTRPRTEIITYTVQKGDTIFGIAEMFNLKPETILWGNRNTLSDDPHNMQPNIELLILPSNGVYHEWSAGEGLNGVTEFYGVTPEDIIQWPGNHLNAETIGDYANPNIEPGTMLFVPGGERGFVTWSAPLGLTRANPAVARLFGPGYCGTIVDGAIGMGSFIWPTVYHWLSGYDWSPGTNHRGIDIGGELGQPLFAADNGVIVYAGWNNYGYGNVVVIDHGNDWQTLYGHMVTVNVVCGQSVYQGDVIGGLGSTGNSSGPHLHFEMIYASGKVNPWDFLP